jgi:hypothetical protein
MAGEGKFGVLHVPDFAPGMSSYIRIGATADDEFTWRDHTDGNRITTTRGDKVEIIRGTYEFAVHGRQDHQAGASADDDGNVFQSGITYRGKVHMPLTKRYFQEKTVKGKVDSTYYGDNVGAYYGSKVTSTTGTESPGEEIPDCGCTGVFKENPEIEDHTWAKKISSYTGSSVLPVPKISQETWVVTMESTTHAESTTDETVVSGAMSSTTKVATVVTSTEADSTSDETTVTGNMENDTTADKIVSTTHADTDDTTHGNSVSHQIGNTESTVVGMEKTVNIGGVAEVVVGIMTDATIGGTVGGTVGASLSVKMAAEASITVGASVSVELGVSLELGPSEISLYLDRTRAAGAQKNVAAAHLL